MMASMTSWTAALSLLRYLTNRMSRRRSKGHLKGVDEGQGHLAFADVATGGLANAFALA